MITGMPASPSCSRAAYVEASMRSPVVIVPSTSENKARTGPRSSESGRVIATRISGNQAQRDVVVRRLERRRAHRGVALTRQPVLEIVVVEPDDAAHLEYR